MHPTLLLLGPVELVGATGPVPPRAAKQCLEYCGWLLEHPGTTARAMASALAVAEGTRRSNMSRLRSWLGADATGEAYLPDAYTGRIAPAPRRQLRLAAACRSSPRPGSTGPAPTRLRAVLGLLRGAPLADAAPGQWHWAEELRTDMISCVRDVGVELAAAPWTTGDLGPRPLGRRPGAGRRARATSCCSPPGSAPSTRPGNTAETERLTLQLAAQARRLGVDLDPATVALLQEVVEGRVRAQLA